MTTISVPAPTTETGGKGLKSERDRLPVEPRDRRRVDRACVLARRHARVHRRDPEDGDARTGDPARLVPADPPDRLRLQVSEPRRPGLRHDVRLGHTRARAVGRLAQRLGDLRRRRDRDGVARGDRLDVHLPALQLDERRPQRGRRADRLGGLDRRDDLDLLPRHRALGAHPAVLARRRDPRARCLRHRRLLQGVRAPSRALDARERRLVQPVRARGQPALRRRPARHLHLLGLGLRSLGQRGDRELRRVSRQGRCPVDADPAADLPARRGCGAGVRRHRLPRLSEQPERGAERARHQGLRLTVGQAPDHRGAHVCVGVDPDDDPADGANDALDGALEGDPGGLRPHPSEISDPKRLDTRDGRALDRVHAVAGRLRLQVAGGAERLGVGDRVLDPLLLRLHRDRLRGVLPQAARRATCGRSSPSASLP